MLVPPICPYKTRPIPTLISNIIFTFIFTFNPHIATKKIPAKASVYELSFSVFQKRELFKESLVQKITSRCRTAGLVVDGKNKTLIKSHTSRFRHKNGRVQGQGETGTFEVEVTGF